MSKTTWVYIFALAMISVGVIACAGFDIGDLIRVSTPNDIQKQTGLTSTTSLNNAAQEYEAWFETVQRAGAQWKANIERGEEVRSLLGQLTLTALEGIGPTVAGVPILSSALPALTGLVGLFIGRGQLRKEKEGSFNKGLKEGRKAPGTE